ncbi:MAG: hypothetical protein DRP75_04770, partial [Candidatus Omnitrophota bacterium]
MNNPFLDLSPVKKEETKNPFMDLKREEVNPFLDLRQEKEIALPEKKEGIAEKILALRPDIALQVKSIKPYLQYGQQAMKLFAIRPDVALGITKPSPEEAQRILELTEKRWADIIRETYPALK